MVLLDPALTLLFCLAFEFPFVCLLIEGLLLGAEHVGDELIADFLWVDLALDVAFLGQFTHLVVQRLLDYLLVLLLLRLLLSSPLVLGAHAAIKHLIHHLLL